MLAKSISISVLSCLFLVNIGLSQSQPPLPPRPLEPNESLPVKNSDGTETNPPPATSSYPTTPSTPPPSSHATSQPSTSSPATAPAPEGTAPQGPAQPGAIGFVMHQPEVRPPLSGYEIGVYGGMFTGITGDHWSLGGVSGATSDGGIAPSAGVKFGYTWPFNPEPIDQMMDETGGTGLRLAGGLEGQLSYIGNTLKITGIDPGSPTGGVDTHTVRLNNASFMINALLKGQIHDFRLYAGPSIGFADVNIASYDYTGWGSPKDDLAFAYGIVGGVEYFIDPHWSIFAEYQYTRYEDVELSTGVSQLTFSPLEENLAYLGVKYHF